ncbi:MAG: hypothetical protein ABWZ85_10570 [Luteibacter sp.]|jgi:type VI secretion system protein
MRAPTLVLLGTLAMSLAGCGAIGKLLPGHVEKTSLDSVRVAAQPGANLDSATRIDLAFVYTSEGVGLMPKTSPEWFGQKASVVSGLGASLDVVSMGVPPAMLLTSLKLPSRHGKAVAVYAYARYVAPAGQARIDLTRYHAAVLWLGPAQITVTEP